MSPPPPTTVAIQTPPGRGGIAVIALAGARTEEILEQAFRPLGSHAAAQPGAIRLGHIMDGDRVIDEVIVARRNEAAEINVHGGPAVAAAALHLLARLGAEVLPAPPAAPGDFPTAHPAWANPAVGEELLRALPDADSSLVAAALTQQWSSGISRLARQAIAAPAGEAGRLQDAAGRLATMQRLLHPAEVVLAGPPNVGKSTLANALVQRAVSIVHDAAGTTRDWVREPALLNGVPVYLTDTAGLWDPPAPGEVDAEAVRRARRRIRQADLVLLLGAGQRSKVPAWLGARYLHVATQCDLSPPFAGADAAVAAVTGDGLDALSRCILQSLGLAEVDPAAPAAFTRRQADLLHRAAEAIRNADPARARHALLELLEG